MTTSNLRPIAAHVLRHLARAQSRGRLVRLDELATDIGVRHEDVREAVSRLHEEGHVDAQRMRLTLSGFVVAASMRECKLRAARVRLERPSQMNVADRSRPLGRISLVFAIERTSHVAPIGTLLLYWTPVTLPLAWGVAQVVTKSLALFG